MKKLLIALLAVIVVLTSTVSAYAASGGSDPTQVGPYEGTFNGRVYGSQGTSAPLTLKMTHRGEIVEGTAFLGEGLYVDGGFCGSGVMPAASESASGQTVSNNPRQLSATSTFKVQGINVTVELESMASQDGETIDAQAKINLPWICGKDPILTGTLYKA